MSGQHLTDDQFADLFMGETAAPQVQAHLASCEQCRAEMAGFTRSVDTFSIAAMGWSEAQPTFSPRSVTLGSLKLATTSRRLFVQAGWVMAGVIVLSVSAPVIWHREHAAVAIHNAVPAANDDSAQQIAQDNDLMQSVNMALQADDPSPLREYRIPDVTGKQMKGRNGVRSQ
jgi:anti-sigma factor RsiW